MRIAIVDDLSLEREKLHQKLNALLLKSKLSFSICEYADGESFLLAAKQARFDLVFLDIYMNGINGVEVAVQLRAFDEDCLLVFTTTSLDHALDGFRVRALHYLVKPYAEKDLEELIKEIIKRQPKQEKFIEVQSGTTLVRLRYHDILYAHNYQHRIYIQCLNKKEVVIRKTFREFSELLEDERFFLCGRGELVNLDHAIDFNGTAFEMKDGKVIPVSRDLIKQARQAFGDYLFTKGI